MTYSMGCLLSYLSSSLLGAITSTPSALTNLPSVTRSHKWNEKHHGGDAFAAPEREPDWFGSKMGNIDSDPKKVKKDGGGKANW